MRRGAITCLLAIVLVLGNTAAVRAGQVEDTPTTLVTMAIDNPPVGDRLMYRVDIALIRQGESFTIKVIGKHPLTGATRERVLPIDAKLARRILDECDSQVWNPGRQLALYQGEAWDYTHWNHLFYLQSGDKTKCIPPQPKGYDKLLVDSFLDIEAVRNSISSLLTEELHTDTSTARFVDTGMWSELIGLELSPSH